MCYELSINGLSFDEVFIPIIRRFLKIAEELKLTIDIDERLKKLEEQLRREHLRNLWQAVENILTAYCLQNF